MLALSKKPCHKYGPFLSFIWENKGCGVESRSHTLNHREKILCERKWINVLSQCRELLFEFSFADALFNCMLNHATLEKQSVHTFSSTLPNSRLSDFAQLKIYLFSFYSFLFFLLTVKINAIIYKCVCVPATNDQIRCRWLSPNVTTFLWSTFWSIKLCRNTECYSWWWCLSALKNVREKVYIFSFD